METTENKAFNFAQKMVDLWFSGILNDAELVNCAEKNFKIVKRNNGTPYIDHDNNESFFLSLFNGLYLRDQERIKLNGTSDICNFLGQDKSDLIKTIYDFEKENLHMTSLIDDWITESNITTKDISIIRKLTELLSQIDENSNNVITDMLDNLFFNSREEESLFHEDNIDYMTQNMTLFCQPETKDAFIKSDAFKAYLPNMVNDNKIEEIKSIINHYTNKNVNFNNLKSILTNIFDLNLQNNEALQDFIKQTSYKLIIEVLCTDYTSYSLDNENPESYLQLNEMDEEDIIEINTTKLKEKLDKYKKEGYNLLFDSEDIPDQFDSKSLIALCFKVLSRITDSITYQECVIIHNQVFKIKSEQINSSITPQEVVTGVDNNTEHNTNQHNQQPYKPINLVC